MRPRFQYLKRFFCSNHNSAPAFGNGRRPAGWGVFLALCVLISGCTATAPVSGDNASGVAEPAQASTETTPAPTPVSTPTPSPTPKPSPTPAPMTVTVDAGSRQQTMVGFGGNYCQVQYTGVALDDIGRYTLETLRPTHVRIPLAMNRWDPDKDAKPRYQTEDPRILETISMIREMRDTYGVAHIIGSIWDAASWMVESETGGTGGVIPDTLYMDTAESIVALLLHIREETGVELDQISFNEPDLGVNVRMGSEATVDFIRIAGPMLDKAGLKTKFLIGDVSQPSPTTQYMDVLLGATDIAPWLGDISYHSWNSSTMSDGLLSAIRKKAALIDKTLIIGEFGYNPGLWKTPEEFPTWQNAWFVANTLYRNIKFAGAQLVLYWELENDYPLMSLDLEPYPAWHVFTQTIDALPPGMTILASQSENESQLGSLAASGEDGSFTLLLLNKTPKDISAVITGAPEKPLQVEMTMEDSYRKDGGQIVPVSGTHTLLIPTKSYVTLSYRP